MKMTKWLGVWGSRSAIGIVLAVTGCGSSAAGDSADDTGGSSSEGTDTRTVGLKRGDSGPAVARLYDQLKGRGYFPSDDLRTAFSNWLPVVAKAPAKSDVFDEALESGLKAYQARSGLVPTGVLDDATATVLAAPTCGYPEFGAHGEDEKFATEGIYFDHTTLTWRLTTGLAGSTTGLTTTTFNTAVNAAFNEWAAHSPFTFTRVADGDNNTTPADITIAFAPTLNDPSWTAQALTSNVNGHAGFALTFLDSVNWVGGLRAMTLHEVGHALSLNHTTVTTCTPGIPCDAGPVMRHWVGNTTALTNDDLISVHARWPQYVNQNRTSRFLTAGGDGSVWSLGPTAGSLGYPISKWTPSGGWTNVSGNGADSIGVESNGVAWATDNTGQVYITSIFGWIPLGSVRVRGIAAGSDQIWALARNTAGDAPIYQWSDAAVDFQLVSGLTAISVAVAPNGTAYALRSNRDVYRRDGSTWTKLDGPHPGNTTNPNWTAPQFANSIKIGANGSIWIITADSTGFKTYLRNDQDASPVDQAPARAQWLLVDGPAGTTSTLDITATADGRLWSTTVNQAAPYRHWRSAD